MTAADFPEELKPYITTVKDGGMELVTVEFRHPQFLDGGQPDPIRVVFDNQDRILPLEATAPLNPGEDVLFSTMPARFAWPDRSKNSRPIFPVEIDDVTYEIIYRLDAVDLGRDPIAVTVREYAPDGTGPYRQLNDLTVARIDAEGQSITVVNAPSQAHSALVPRRTYTRDKFPLG